MALERSDVEKIAHLARLGLNDADIPQTTATLNNILGLIDAMQSLRQSTFAAAYVAIEVVRNGETKHTVSKELKSLVVALGTGAAVRQRFEP